MYSESARERERDFLKLYAKSVKIYRTYTKLYRKSITPTNKPPTLNDKSTNTMQNRPQINKSQ